MYLVTETYIAKPGHAGELARSFKEEMGKIPNFKCTVLLDMVTDYNKIVVQYELKSLAEFEQSMTQHKKEQAKSKKTKPAKYTEMYLTGRREIFKIL
ncbi:hypothetical protein KW782_03265 [Candidatus Parcubacteria bacterium]|nr:hypothetical protein [Candidatus Parcubacteria bacterium]